MQLQSALHLCCCGCGNEVIIPFARDQWVMTFDGSVSIRPSIGNAGFPCRSHYFLTRNQVQWAPNLTDEGIERAKLGRRIVEELPAVSSERAPWMEHLIGWVRRRPKRSK